MTSTPTARNRFNKQSTGSNRYTWGTVQNNQVFDLIDESLDGVETIDLTADKTLSATNYVSDESRNRGLKFTDTGGVLTGAVTVTLPSNEKIYWIINDTAQSVILDAGGTTGTIEAGRRKWISVDSSNNVDVGEDGADKEFTEATYLKLTGGTLTGPLTLSGAPTEDLHASTKAYADSKVSKTGDTVTGPLKYSADLSGSYDDRTLVDRAFVYDVAMGSVSISFDWADVTGKPTTLAGFGITDPLLPYTTLSGDITATINNHYGADSTTASRTVTLPAHSENGVVILSDEDGNAGTNNAVLSDGTDTWTLDTNYGWLALVSKSGAWKIKARG